MKVIRPTIVTDAILVSSDIPEGAGAAWNAGTTYALGSRVDVSTGTVIDVYQGLRDGNRLLYSQQFDNAAWHGAGVTRTADAALAPDGTMTADKIVEDASNGIHILGQDIAASNVTVVYSVYLKAAERTHAFVEISNTVSWSVFIIVDLAAGQITTMNAPNADFSNLSSGIVAVGGGWYRCWIKATKAAVNTIVGGYVHPANAAGDYAYAGVAGSGVYAWGAQLELGSSVGPYVPTTGAAALNINNPPAASPNWWRKVATTYAAYNAATNYAKDVIVSSAASHRRYQSLQAGNTGHALTDTAWWLDIGATNRWAMFDQAKGSLSTVIDQMQIVLSPGRIDSLVLLDVAGKQATVVVTVGGVVVYNKTQVTAIGGRSIDNWYDWFFAPIGVRTSLLFDDLPSYRNGVVTVTIEATSDTSAVSVGTLLIGRMFDIGTTLSDAVLKRRNA